MLRQIAVDPPFSPAKTRIINELTYFDATRFLLETKAVSGRSEHLNGGARTDGPADIWDMSFGQKGRQRPDFADHRGTTGSSRSWSKIAGRPAGELWRRPGRRGFPANCDRSCKKAFVQIWGRDPYAGGAFSVFKPGQMTAWAAYGGPEGRVHFAGEHLSPWNGWMEGALWSGERAAQEIIQA